MENLVFKRLVVASDTLKSGNQFEFKPRFNLITANDNSVGKSTLAKLLFWALGGDPVLDVTWTGFDVRCLVDFSVGNQTYQAGRYGNIMFLRRPNGEWEKFPKITGAYSDAFAEIVGFEALLPSRSDSTKLETPPPAFYFLPFYVDQQRSWSHAWNGFTNLEQYAKWQKTIIEYHTGYLRPEFFTFEEKIAAQNLEKKLQKVKLERLRQLLM
ncbi:TPA: ATP-binding protein [Pseudomonas aeruginosa]